MPFNPLMLNNINKNKKVKLPKEKPAKPKKSLRERLYCWLLIILSSILAGGESKYSPSLYFTAKLLRVNISVVPQSDGGGPSSQSPLRQISNISFK